MLPRFNLSRDKKDTIGCFSWSDDYCHLQFHSSLEICMVDEGEIEMMVDGKTKTMTSGDIAVALSFSPHAYKTPVHSVTSNIFIPIRMCEEFTSAMENKKLASSFISSPTVYEEIKKYFFLLQNESITSLKQIGYVYVILGIILENTVQIDKEAPTDTDLISKILFYISENYNKNISPSQISKHFGYSQSHISRYFKASCGVNLVRYIAVIRLQKAIAMMNEGEHNMTYCIMESGFPSISSFYRNFKNEFGCSPKEYISKMNLQP